ncbi:Myb-like DNA-binding domain-containing protein 2 [Elsinoe fawcettii]|nr:Myb-like DNA-binding domain-containing protein 2 [Elsinoe fawcettii]
MADLEGAAEVVAEGISTDRDDLNLTIDHHSDNARRPPGGVATLLGKVEMNGGQRDQSDQKKIDGKVVSLGSGKDRDSSSRPPTPSQSNPPQPPTPSERPQPDMRMPMDRRASTSFLPRPEVGTPTDQTARAEAFGARPRASSPPQAPSVPAFGAMNFSKPPPNQPPPSNVWRAPPEARQPPEVRQPPSPVPPGTVKALSPLPKPVPTAPKALAMSPTPGAAIPSGPTSPGIQRTPIEPPRGPRSLDAPIPPTAAQSKNTPQPPTGPAAFRDERPIPPPFPSPAARDRPPMPALSSGAPSPSFGSNAWSQPAPPTPKSVHSDIPTIHHSPSMSRPIPAGPSQEPRARVEHTPPVPTGPRQQQSPLLTSPRVPPTAPKADRAPPTGPRVSLDRGMAALTRAPERPPIAPQRSVPPAGPRGGPPAWSSWQQQRPFREGIVPAKRDANGDEVPRYPSASPNQSRAVPVVKQEESKVQDDGNQAAEAKVEQGADRKDVGDIDDMGDPIEPTLDSSSDDDDGMDLDEEDFEMPTRKFEERKAQLELQKVDLSAREYRVTTPFEQIARIAKITVDDLPTESEGSPEAEAPELEEEAASGVASGSTEDIDQDLLTPKEEEAEDVVMRDSDALDNVLPVRREPSPEIINLPYLSKEPCSPGERLQAHIVAQEQAKPVILDYLRTVQQRTEATEKDVAEDFAIRYRELRDVTRRIDDERGERERLERQKSADTAGETTAAALPLDTPTTEGSRRLHKYSSEYDIQKVLKESEEMARKEQEKMEKDAQKARDSLEKEAVCPLLYEEELLKRTVFKNTNNLRHPEQLIAIFGYQPPADDFSAEEHDVFLSAFKERPKKWGEIAAQLPGRTYQHCIHHYYAHKWDGRFRETKGKRKGRAPGRGRGAKVGTRVRGAALMADLTRTEDDVPAPTTENGTNANGRPKRAAAARGAAQETQPESRAASATPARKTGKTEGEEKPVKKRRTAAGDKTSKRAKAQPLAAAGTEASTPQAGSPVKQDRELQFRTNELTNEEKARMDEANLLAGFQAGTTRPRTEAVPVYHTPNFFDSSMPAPENVERPRIPVVSSSQRQSASSYWSVPEQTDFLKFLAYYGTDFGAIAAQMGTKTQTMVKNHYQRRIEGDQKEEFLAAAETANARRQRGEDLGPPPTPTPIIKRRYDNPPTAGTRPGTAQAEVVEEEPGRFPTSAPPPGPIRTAPTPLQTALATATAKAAAQNVPRPPQAPGPRMGFFSESAAQRPPTTQQPPTTRPPPQPVQAQQQSQSATPQRDFGQQTAWYQNLLLEQERAIKLQAESARSNERVPQLPHQNVYPHLAPQPPSQPEPARQVEEKGPPAPPPRPASGPMRNVLGSPAPSIAAPPPVMPPAQAHPGQNPSPPKMTGFRPSSVPVPVPAASPVQSSNLSVNKPAEPRKTSNLASLLNSEPEEPRPIAKRMSDHSIQGVTRPQSPASIQRNPTPTSSVLGQRRDTFGSNAPPPRFPYDRPAQTTPGPPAQPKYESLWSNVAPARRDEWPPRQQPPPPSASPGPNALERQDRFYPHRSSALAQLNTPARANPSPPPHLTHSRHGSFSTPAGPPQQPPPPHPMSGHPMNANPYGQPPPPHMSQHNSPVNQAPPNSVFHTRRPSREEDYRAQAAEKWGYRPAERREFERPPLSTPASLEREREAQAQAQAQAQYARDRDTAFRERDARDREAQYVAAAEARYRSNTGPPPPGPGIGGPPMNHPSGHPSAPPPQPLHAPMSQPPPGYAPAPPAGPGFRPEERYDAPFSNMREREAIFRREQEGYQAELRERENAYARDRDMQRERDMAMERDRRDREVQRQRDYDRERQIQQEREQSMREREREDWERERQRDMERRGEFHQPQAFAPPERREYPPPPAPTHPAGPERGRHEFLPPQAQREPHREEWRRPLVSQVFEGRPATYGERQAMEEENRRRRDEEMRMMQREPYLPRSASGGSMGSVQGYPPPGQGPPQPQGPGMQVMGGPPQGPPLGGFRHHPGPGQGGPGGPGMGAPPPGAPTGPRR